MIRFIRFLFVAGCAWLGYLFPMPLIPTDWGHTAVLGASVGCFLGILVVCIDIFFKRFTVRNILSVLLGAALGLLVHKLLMSVLAYSVISAQSMSQFAMTTAIFFVYMGVITVLRGQDEVTTMIPFVTLDTKGNQEELILLDTSVIIDGRISDICKTHFMSGKFILPRFVLKELQLISDSSDPLKRNRGRRGLDVLNKIKTNPNMQVKIHEMDFPELNTVDAKLVKMAQVIGGKVFTNDYNLNKVAEIQGIKVLNINELANALKPVVMPGEMMTVKIIKEGKEHDQGIAYLDDGTMVVVDNGRRRIGQTFNVTITSVLQTQAGRMIFAKMGDEPDRPDRGIPRQTEYEAPDRNPRLERKNG